VAEFVDELTGTLIDVPHPYKPANVRPNHTLMVQRRYLQQRFFRSRARASSAPQDRPIAVRAVFCSTIPWLVSDKAVLQGTSSTENIAARANAAPANAAASRGASPAGGGEAVALAYAAPRRSAL
jgi:hypothetical protein